MKNIELINFIDLTYEEKELVLSWRNHPTIKKWMFNDNTIELEQHLNFIKVLRNTKDKKYFVVKQGDNYIGVIDFCNITNNSLIMGLYKNPKMTSVGKILLNIIIEYSFKTFKVKNIISEVFESNEKAYELYISIGFKPFSSRIVNNKKVICMELKNENR